MTRLSLLKPSLGSVAKPPGIFTISYHEPNSHAPATPEFIG
nr:MAG TPA: hypothetical protein [Caudoviricetes sp.]